jgi:hypothetical protein
MKSTARFRELFSERGQRVRTAALITDLVAGLDADSFAGTMAGPNSLADMMNKGFSSRSHGSSSIRL